MKCTDVSWEDYGAECPVTQEPFHCLNVHGEDRDDADLK